LANLFEYLFNLFLLAGTMLLALNGLTVGKWRTGLAAAILLRFICSLSQSFIRSDVVLANDLFFDNKVWMLLIGCAILPSNLNLDIL
ncbi:hypothetical protein ACSJLL_25000, partial [Enterobacter kobei]